MGYGNHHGRGNAWQSELKNSELSGPANEEVPFRSHAGDDPVSLLAPSTVPVQADSKSMLWDQILLDSWQEIFHDRAVCKLTLEETKMDDVTIDFIDGVR